MRKTIVVWIFVGLITFAVLSEYWVALAFAIVLLVLLPPSWDPAIRFKEWIEGPRKP